jgi:methyl-accepting chemotaxis protein
MEQQISLLSLNTTIHCSRLGDDGSALRVIAQNLRDLAGQTVAAAGAIMDALRQSEVLAQSLTQDRSSSVANELFSLERDAATAMGLFKTIVGRLHNGVTTMDAAGPRAVRHLEIAADSVSNRRDFIESWRDAKIEILSLAPLGLEAVNMAATDAGLMAQLRAHYTMDGERHVHDALLGAACEPDTVGSASTAQADLDDIFF